ncbi:hypothetical protein ACFRAE_00175 [Sphingobacterium sp. HJSM2_6]|uniref:hypothetical protein n=1 Tax=Sphingobacterium sp. HJSM2_6 TaxID=3366264 RepID=UPI003BC9285C
MRKKTLLFFHRFASLQIRLILLLISTFLLLEGCKKDNLNYSYDYRYNTEARKASNIRLINFSEKYQLVVNGDSLTNFWTKPTRPGFIPPEETTAPATPYFPKNGLFSRVWEFPQNLFKPDGTAHIKTTTVFQQADLKNEVNIVVKEELDRPKDYYFLFNEKNLVEWDKPVVEVARDITSPRQPDHFKIRIINFAAKTSTMEMENLVQPLTLTFADGTPVNTETSNIPVGTVSSYVEIPYGTYQFKILTNDGRQVPMEGQEASIDPKTSTMDRSDGSKGSGIVYSELHTYQPGGIYTIVIHPRAITYMISNDQASGYQNVFNRISDISEPVNQTYARVQLANAFAEGNLSLQVKDRQIEGSVSFGKATAYQNIIHGVHDLQVYNGAEKLADVKAQLRPGGNYTLWVFPDASGALKTQLISNNLSGTWYTGTGTSGNNTTEDRRKIAFRFDIRCLNFCPDIPELTFTDDQGVPMGRKFDQQSASHLAFNMPQISEPYIRLVYDQPGPYLYYAYASSSNKLPGDWLQEITGLSNKALIANEKLYTAIGRDVPTHEPGVYTLALVGRYKQGNSNAKIMLIKHTK